MTPRFATPALGSSCCALLLLLGSTPNAFAAWPHTVTGSVPVCINASTQSPQAAVSDGAGGAIFAWRDARTDPGDVYVQRLDAYGHQKWLASGQPVCTAAGTQDQIAMTADGKGGAWLAWRDARSGSQDIYIARVSAEGAVTPANGIAVCTALGNQGSPRIEPYILDQAVVVWEDSRSGNVDLYAQRYGIVEGLLWATDGVPIVVAVGDQTLPAIVVNLLSSRVGVAWQDTRSGGIEVFAQALLGTGSPTWALNGIRLSAAAGNEIGPAVVLVGSGDLIVAWTDGRSLPAQVYAQRLGEAAGAAAWMTDGVALAPASGLQYPLKMVSDGLGGAIVVWTDFRDPTTGLYAQHVTAQGLPTWTTSGVPVTAGWGFAYSAIAPDLQGGVLVAWTDSRFGSSDVFVQRLDGMGRERWTSNGLRTSDSNSQQTDVVLASDMNGGAIVGWGESPFGTPDFLAKHADRWGILGAEPEIADVADVPNDQGGLVKVSWYASPLETDPDFEFVVGNYIVFRSVPTSVAMERIRAGARAFAPDEFRTAAAPALMRMERAGVTSFWEQAGVQSAFQLPAYSLVVPTTGDSVAGSNPYTQFLVQARAGLGDKWWASEPDSAYSVDDLAPTAPAPFSGQYSSGATLLNWDPNPESDLAGYRLYRGATASFVPGPGNLVAEIGGTEYVDNPGLPYFYKLSAVDVHGNESPFAFLQPDGTTDTPGQGVPADLRLAPVTPNPVRALAAIRYGLPRETRVTLAIFDATGRRIRSLLQGRVPAGEHSARWDGLEDSGARAPSGLYFLRLEAAGRVLTRSFALMR